MAAAVEPVMHTRLASLLLAVPFSLLAACQWNEVEQGYLGQLELIPDDCGQTYCDLDDGIAAGASLSVTLRGKGSTSAYGLTLISDSPWIADVVGLESGGSEPTFRVVGRSAGIAQLVAIDPDGYEVDYLPVEVATIADLEVSLSGDGTFETTVDGFDSAYEVAVGADVDLDLAATSRGRDLTGDFEYAAFFDTAVAESLRTGSDIGAGRLRLNLAAPGDHTILFVAPGGASERIWLRAR
jgi:hypothetical protein